MLIEGCALQIAGLAALAVLAVFVDAPTPVMLALTMIVFGYGQGLVMAPLSGAVLDGEACRSRLGIRHVRHNHTDR